MVDSINTKVSVVDSINTKDESNDAKDAVSNGLSKVGLFKYRSAIKELDNSIVDSLAQMPVELCWTKGGWVYSHK